MSKSEEAVLRAIADAPGSLRALSREAGVPHSTLVRIKKGQRGATPEVAKRLADALERWAGSCSSGADLLRGSLSQEVDK